MISKEDVFGFSPCAAASHEMVDALFAGRELIAASDVLASTLEDEHKLWLLLRPELISEQHLSEIRADFIALIDQDWLVKLCETCPAYETIGRVARCFDRPYIETYAELIQVVEKYIA
jgi:hypothetical protein